MKLTRSLAEKIVCSRCFSIKFPPNTDQGPLDSINQIRHDDTRRQMLSCWRTCMSYRNAVDVLTIAARAASLRGVSLAEIEEILERDYRTAQRSEEHTSELQSLMRISYAVFCLKQKKKKKQTN